MGTHLVEPGRTPFYHVEHLENGGLRYPSKYAVSSAEEFSDLARPLYHGEEEQVSEPPNELFRWFDPDEFPEIVAEDIYERLSEAERRFHADYYDGESGLFEAYWEWRMARSRSQVYRITHLLIVRALYAALLGEANPLEFHWLEFTSMRTKSDRKTKAMRTAAKKRLAEILPPSKGKNRGKGRGMTPQAAGRYLDSPELMTAEQVQAIIDATGVTLEFLRGQVLEPTATARHGDARGLAAIYDELSDRGKETLWSVAVALQQGEQAAH